MRKDQEFPVSIEVQFLGGNGKDKRPTGNVCTPGTNIVMKDKLITQHCIDSRSKTYHGDEWVTVEVEVHGNGPSSTSSMARPSSSTKSRSSMTRDPDAAN